MTIKELFNETWKLSNEIDKILQAENEIVAAETRILRENYEALVKKTKEAEDKYLHHQQRLKVLTAKKTGISDSWDSLKKLID